jgi:predicted transcriptional regulator
MLGGILRRRSKVGLDGLGALERRVMEAIWQRGGDVSVRDLVEAFGHQSAYTTLMTTADRLFKKGLLDRRRAGRAFLYAARVSAVEARWRPARALLDGLLEKDAPLVLSFLVDAVSTRAQELLDDLERLIRAKRRESGPT